MPRGAGSTSSSARHSSKQARMQPWSTSVDLARQSDLLLRQSILRIPAAPSFSSHTQLARGTLRIDRHTQDQGRQTGSTYHLATAGTASTARMATNGGVSARSLSRLADAANTKLGRGTICRLLRRQALDSITWQSLVATLASMSRMANRAPHLAPAREEQVTCTHESDQRASSILKKCRNKGLMHVTADGTLGPALPCHCRPGQRQTRQSRPTGPRRNPQSPRHPAPRRPAPRTPERRL